MSAAKKLDKDFTFYKNKAEALEKELQDLKSAPKDYQPMVEISRAIAHEINTPLSVILMKAEVSLKKLNETPADIKKVKNSLEKITVTVNKISGIINSLQSYSKMNFTQPFLPVPLHDILDSATEYTHEFLTPVGVKLTANLPDKNTVIFCRTGEIAQVITNLIKNSIDAITDLPEKWICLEAEEKVDHVLIRVTDSGHGILKEHSNKVFQPFYTEKKEQKGMGIGLSLSRIIIEAHGGELSINKDCPNTQFVIKLLKKPQHRFHNEEKA